MKKLAVIALLFGGVLLLAGCEGSSAPQSISTPQKVENMVRARQLFDKAKGDWNALSASEQEEYAKNVGGKKADAERWWNKMKNPAGAGAPIPGPGGASR